MLLCAGLGLWLGYQLGYQIATVDDAYRLPAIVAGGLIVVGLIGLLVQLRRLRR